MYSIKGKHNLVNKPWLLWKDFLLGVHFQRSYKVHRTYWVAQINSIKVCLPMVDLSNKTHWGYFNMHSILKASFILWARPRSGQNKWFYLRSHISPEAANTKGKIWPSLAPKPAQKTDPQEDSNHVCLAKSTKPHVTTKSLKLENTHLSDIDIKQKEEYWENKGQETTGTALNRSTYAILANQD